MPHGVDDRTRETMRQILGEIQDGTFAREWIAENEAGGRENFMRMRQEHTDHDVERVGKQLRAMMPWLKSGKMAREDAKAAMNAQS